jgi:Flp pilus assembly protein TadG
MTRTRGDRGQSLVETALSLSILVFLLLGGADLARAFSAQVGVLNAARAGAEARVTRAAATDAAAQTYALDELGRVPGVDPALATVTCTSPAGGDLLTTCRVQYPFRTLVAWPLVPNSIALDRSAVFRRYP